MGRRQMTEGRKLEKRTTRREGTAMRRSKLGLSTILLGVTLLTGRAWADDLVFLSTQLRPIEEAQKVREIILKGAPVPVSFVTEDPPALPVRIKAEQQGGKHTISLIGALHG